METDDEGSVHKWREAFRSVLAELPKPYLEAAPFASAMRQVFHEELAWAMEPRLNEHLRNLPSATYEDKKALSSWANRELHYELGLTIRCPRTRKPAILVADLRDARGEASRFRLSVPREGGRSEKTLSSVALPELNLMMDPPRREAFSIWRREKKENQSGR